MPEPQTSAPPKVYDVTITALITVQVSVGDPSALSRVVENDDGWRESYYQLRTAAEALTMMADNCARNGVGDAKRLDGWADLPPGAVTMRVAEWHQDGVTIHPNPAEEDTP